MPELSHKGFHKLLDRRFHYLLFEDFVETLPKPKRKARLESTFQNLVSVTCLVMSSAVARQLPSAMFLTNEIVKALPLSVARNVSIVTGRVQESA